jgi:hypothetical protein
VARFLRILAPECGDTIFLSLAIFSFHSVCLRLQGVYPCFPLVLTRLNLGALSFNGAFQFS